MPSRLQKKNSWNFIFFAIIYLIVIISCRVIDGTSPDRTLLWLATLLHQSSAVSNFFTKIKFQLDHSESNRKTCQLSRLTLFQFESDRLRWFLSWLERRRRSSTWSGPCSQLDSVDSCGSFLIWLSGSRPY